MKKSMVLVAALTLSFCSGAFAASQPAQQSKHPVAQNNKAPQHTSGGKHSATKKSGNHKRPQNNNSNTMPIQPQPR